MGNFTRRALTIVAAAFAVPLLVAAANPQPVPPPASAPSKIDERKLIGAWRLVYSEMRTPDGRVFPAPTYGPNPHGYLIYDASHVMCVFLAVGEPGTATPPAKSPTDSIFCDCKSCCSSRCLSA